MTDIITNQIAKIQTAKKLIALYDKLNPAQACNYAQIHAKGEENASGRKVYSLIGIEVQDYSAGTGNLNKIVKYNLAPEEIQFLLTKVELGYVNYEFNETKIFGEPDENGLCEAHKISILRMPVDKNGNAMGRPWLISVEDGKGVKAGNQNGGFYMVGGSYKVNKTASINLTDAEFYKLLKRADSYIRNWETVTAMRLIPDGRQAYGQYVKSLQQRSPQYQQSSYNNAYDNPGIQYDQQGVYAQPADYNINQYQYTYQDQMYGQEAYPGNNGTAPYYGAA